MFDIALLNPLRFIDTSDINYGFDGNFAVDRLLSYQNPKCYFQKWQHSDDLYLQVISDFEPTDILFKDIYTDLVIATAAWQAKDLVIVDHPDTVIYELEFSFTDLPDGKYYAEFTYVDEDELEHVLMSEPLCVAEIQDNTLLIKYKHHENDFDIIFGTEIEFAFRVEAAIKKLDPKNIRSVYTSQKVNATQLSAVPYRVFKLYIGYRYGVTEWVIDKVNRIQSVDQVKYNDVSYQVTDEAEFEIEYNDDNNFLGGSIDVQPVDNNFTKYRTESPDTPNTFTPMQKVIPYYNVAGNFPVADYFKKFSVLEKICIDKRSVGSIDLLVGTTPGGDEIGSFTVDDAAFTQTIEWMFNGTTTVYLTGLAGTDCDIFLIYKQLDEPPVDLGSGSTVIPPVVGKGAVWIYEEVMPGDFNLDFDASTGLGRDNTDWSDWVMCDGRNGTEDRGGVIPVGIKTDDPDYDTIGKRGGSKTHQLTVDELPKFKPVLRHSWTQRGGTGSALVYAAFGTDVATELDEVGGDVAHSIVNPYLTSQYVKKYK